MVTSSTKQPILRLLTIHRLLHQQQPITARQLAERLEVSARTIYRDMDYLRDELRAPLVFDHLARTYRYSAPWSLELGEMIPQEVTA